MLNNDLTSSDSRRGHKDSYTSIVILQKDSNGTFHACPVSEVDKIRSPIYSLKSTIERLAPHGVVHSRPYRQKNPTVRRFAAMPEYYLGTLNVQSGLLESTKRKQCKLVQRGKEPSSPVLMTSVSSAKRPNKVLFILLTAGGIFLITKHKKLIGLATSLGQLLIKAIRNLNCQR